MSNLSHLNDQSPINFIEQTKALLKVTQKLTIGLNKDLILNDILEKCKEFFRPDTGMILLFDEDEEMLIPHNYFGFKDYVKLIGIQNGEGISGESFLSRKSNLYTYPEDVRRAMENIDQESKMIFQDSLVHWDNETPSSTMCAILQYDNLYFGVLIIDFYAPDKYFSELDFNLFKIYAEQASTSYYNSILLNNEKDKVSKLNSALSSNKKLLSESLQGKSVEDICESLSNMVDLPVRLFDEFLFSRFQSDDFTRSVDSLENYLYEEYFHHGSFTLKEGLAIYPIKFKSEILGFFVLQLKKEAVDDFIKKTIEHGVDLIALKLIKEKEVYDTKQKMVNEMIDEFLIHKQESTFVQRLKGFDIKNNIPCYHIIFDIKEKERMEEVHRIIINKSTALPYKPLLTSKGVLFFTTQGKKELERFLNTLLEVLTKFNLSTAIIVGRMVNSIVEIDSSYKDALSILQKRKVKYGNVILFDDLTIEKLFLQTNRGNIDDFVNTVLKDLSPSNMKNKVLFDTLASYIRNDKLPHETSTDLNIHVNTLYYRLKVIEKKLNIQLSNQKDWLNIHLAVKLSNMDLL
ncbi:helix-turn-helix domain-containing protein [Sporosarcina siberiensis]|uniref:Helix-turn-helix domain-containing protein n=1 Tax=Sporosarcina siberiensis TaxID=1365606 RepID=A0ABW4SII9_9BACL